MGKYSTKPDRGEWFVQPFRHSYIGPAKALTLCSFWRKFAVRNTKNHITMKTSTIFNLCFGAGIWIFLAVASTPAIVAGCSKKEKNVETRVSNEGLLLNDDLVAVRKNNGNISIKNTETGKITLSDISLDWTQSSGRDSLGVFCSEDKRGYYNMYTGEIAIPAQYRRAWVFSEGLAAVQKNGMIGFIDHKGNTVIGFDYPYHGNPLSEFIFKDGHCVVADTLGKCGVIDKTGAWLIRPEYESVVAFKDFAIVSREGVRLQVGYDGKVINSFVLDSISPLEYEEVIYYENREGEMSSLRKSVRTGFFSYRVGGRCGLMDSNCKRLTEPLFSTIIAESKTMFRGVLPDRFSEVILNDKGEVMK